MSKPLCGYHESCVDGFAAAWAVRDALGEQHVEFFPAAYQTPPPDVTGREVFLVDFSYKRAVILEMAKSAKSILILDHHKTAIEDLKDVAFESPFAKAPILCVFDLARSGAGIAWDHFHVGTPRPRLINHIEDRDLGGGIAFPPKLAGTREIHAVVASYPYEFDAYGQLVGQCERDFAGMVHEGRGILRKHDQDLDTLLPPARRELTIAGHVVPAANLPPTMASDAGHRLAAGFPFAAIFWLTGDGVTFSLRSAHDGIDVSAIAKQYGGGGHARAAGFRAPFDRLAEFGF